MPPVEGPQSHSFSLKRFLIANCKFLSFEFIWFRLALWPTCTHLALTPLPFAPPLSCIPTLVKQTMLDKTSGSLSNCGPRPYKVTLLLNSHPASLQALQFATNLMSSLSVPSTLIVAYIMALNPPGPLPGLASLDKAYNLSIEDEASLEVAKVKGLLAKWNGRLNYEFLEVEGEGETGPLILEFIESQHNDSDLVVVGSRNLGSLQRYVVKCV